MRFLSTLSWEVRGTATKPLPHLWSAQHNLTRVFAITDHSEECLAPAVERFGRSRRVGPVENWWRGLRVALRQ